MNGNSWFDVSQNLDDPRQSRCRGQEELLINYLEPRLNKATTVILVDAAHFVQTSILG